MQPAVLQLQLRCSGISSGSCNCKSLFYVPSAQSNIQSHQQSQPVPHSSTRHLLGQTSLEPREATPASSQRFLPRGSQTALRKTVIAAKGKQTEGFPIPVQSMPPSLHASPLMSHT